MSPKVFDINAPSRMSPQATSRPIIVGHQPMMTDPMVRPQTSANTETTPQAVADFSSPHKAKVIEVSSEIKNDLAAAQPASPQELPPAPGELPIAEPLPPTPAQSDAQAPVADQASSPMPAGAPNAAPQSTSPAPAPQPVSQPDLTHIPHVPVSHDYHHGGGRLKSMLMWSMVIIFLVAFGVYLLTDAGFIGNASKLPVHIFTQGS